MYLNKKSKILFLIINLSLVGFLLLNDPRSYLIAEPFDTTIQAITIAISKLEYGAKNYLGLKEVYLHLKNIPHVANFSSGYKYLLEGSLLNFDSLRKEVLDLIPNFTKLNELPSFKESEMKNTSSSFISEEINIKELDYYFTNFHEVFPFNLLMIIYLNLGYPLLSPI